MRVALYSRVSTQAQSREGASLETQEQLARDRCTALGWTLSAIYTDVMSGRKDDRPELARMLEDARAGRIDAVFVYRLDRLGRSLVRTLQVVGELADAGVRLVSLTQAFEIDGSLGKLMLSIYASFAEMESEAIGARIRDNRRQRVQTEGKHYAVPPYGYKRVDGKMIPNEDTAPHVRRLFEEAAKGRGLRSMVVELNQEGVRTSTGRLWSQAGLKVLLRNPAYMGMITHGRKPLTRTSKGQIKRKVLQPGEYLLVKGDHEPLVSQERWEAVQRHLDVNKGVPARTAGAAARTPWMGLLRCGVCGSRLSMHRKGKGRREHVQFSCCAKDHSGPMACTLRGISLTLLSGALVRAMADRLAHGNQAADKRRKKPKQADNRVAQIAKIEAAIRRESDLYRMEAQNYATTEANIKALRIKLESLSQGQAAPVALPPKIDNFIELWRGLPEEDRAGLARSLVDTVTLYDETISLTWRSEFRDHLGEGLNVERPKLRGSAVTAYAVD